MDVNRLSDGEKIAGISAVLLFIFMFFDWFGVKVSSSGISAQSVGGGNAWDALDVIPIFLILAIIAVIAMVVVRANDSQITLPVPLSAIATVLSGLGLLLILYRIIDPPGADSSFSGIEVDVTRKLGVYISFLAAAAMTYGSWRAMQEEGTSFQDAADSLGGGSGPGTGAGGTADDPYAAPPPPSDDPYASPPPPSDEPPSAPPPPPPPPPSGGAPPSA
jgi:hypothetical protein